MANFTADIKIRSVSYDGFMYKILCRIKNTGDVLWDSNFYNVRCHSIERDQGVILDVVMANDSWKLPNDVSPGQTVEMELHVPSGPNSSVWGFRDQTLCVDVVYDYDVNLGGEWSRSDTVVQLSGYEIPNVFTDSEFKKVDVGGTPQKITFDFTVYQLTIQVAEPCDSDKIVYIDENGENATVDSFELRAGDVHTFTRKIDKETGISLLSNQANTKVKIIARR